MGEDSSDSEGDSVRDHGPPSESSDGSLGSAVDSDASNASQDEEEVANEGWVERDNIDYRFVGLRTQMVYIPKFMFGLFADGGKPVLAPSIGPEYVTRRNGFEVDTWLMFGSYGMDDAPFKSKSDPDIAYEIVRSELKTLTVGADFLWTKKLNDKGLSLAYGAGAGIGVVFGSLYRTQSYSPTGQPGDPEGYQACPAPHAGPGDYCGADNSHYDDYTEPSWLDGGSKPVLFPWIALPQIGLRWKASKVVVLRLDTGLSLPGPFFLGVSGQVGLL